MQEEEVEVQKQMNGSGSRDVAERKAEYQQRHKAETVDDLVAKGWPRDEARRAVGVA